MQEEREERRTERQAERVQREEDRAARRAQDDRINRLIELALSSRPVLRSPSELP